MPITRLREADDGPEQAVSRSNACVVAVQPIGGKLMKQGRNFQLQRKPRPERGSEQRRQELEDERHEHEGAQ